MVSKRGCKTAAADARITKEDDLTGRFTSGGVMPAAEIHIASVGGTGGVVDAGEENQGTIAEMWVNCQDEILVFVADYCAPKSGRQGMVLKWMGFRKMRSAR